MKAAPFFFFSQWPTQTRHEIPARFRGSHFGLALPDYIGEPCPLGLMTVCFGPLLRKFLELLSFLHFCSGKNHAKNHIIRFEILPVI
jgi:hypothetical protein